MTDEEHKIHLMRLRAKERYYQRQLYKIQHMIEEAEECIPMMLEEKGTTYEELFTWPWQLESFSRDTWYQLFPEQTHYLHSIGTCEGELLHYDYVTHEILYMSNVSDEVKYVPPPLNPLPVESAIDFQKH